MGLEANFNCVKRVFYVFAHDSGDLRKNGDVRLACAYLGKRVGVGFSSVWRSRVTYRAIDDVFEGLHHLGFGLGLHGLGGSISDGDRRDGRNLGIEAGLGGRGHCDGERAGTEQGRPRNRDRP